VVAGGPAGCLIGGAYVGAAHYLVGAMRRPLMILLAALGVVLLAVVVIAIVLAIRAFNAYTF